MKIKEIFEGLVKFWDYVWNGDSLLSWILSIIFAFIIIKFLVYPGLGLLLGTEYPVVAVVSSSMEHDKIFDGWWEENKDFYLSFNITKSQFLSFNFKNGFNKGDIMVLVRAKNIKMGNIIVFEGDAPAPIIHRVIKLNGGIQTKGDNNLDSREDEVSISKNRIYGRAVFRIPFLGWIKILFLELIKLVIP